MDTKRRTNHSYFWKLNSPPLGHRWRFTGVFCIDNVTLSIIVAAAQHMISDAMTSRWCTWKSTRWDDYFDLPSTLRYLRAEGNEPNESLLQRYSELHRNHKPFDLAGIELLAPWIERIEYDFVDYSSFRLIRNTTAFKTIVTFTTPAISESSDLAFLELWTEDGRYAQMGCWWWIQMRCQAGRWTVDWKNMHKMS